MTLRPPDTLAPVILRRLAAGPCDRRRLQKGMAATTAELDRALSVLLRRGAIVARVRQRPVLSRFSGRAVAAGTATQTVYELTEWARRFLEAQGTDARPVRRRAR